MLTPSKLVTRVITGSGLGISFFGFVVRLVQRVTAPVSRSADQASLAESSLLREKPTSWLFGRKIRLLITPALTLGAGRGFPDVRSQHRSSEKPSTLKETMSRVPSSETTSSSPSHAGPPVSLLSVPVATSIRVGQRKSDSKLASA